MGLPGIAFISVALMIFIRSRTRSKIHEQVLSGDYFAPPQIKAAVDFRACPEFAIDCECRARPEFNPVSRHQIDSGTGSHSGCAIVGANQSGHRPDFLWKSAWRSRQNRHYGVALPY